MKSEFSPSNCVRERDLFSVFISSYPGGAIFLIHNYATRKCILHAGDHRLSVEIDDNMKLANSEVDYIYFDPRLVETITNGSRSPYIPYNFTFSTASTIIFGV